MSLLLLLSFFQLSQQKQQQRSTLSVVVHNLLLLLLLQLQHSKATKSAADVSDDETSRRRRQRTDMIIVSPIGDPINVWSSVDTLHKCNGIIDVPDIPVRVFVNPTTDVVHMIDGSTHYHKMYGNSSSNIFNVTRDCDVSWNMTGNYDPASYANNEFLDSTYAFDNGTVISLLHNEYPGNVYNNCENNGGGKGSYPYCWQVSIGLAISYDWGNTWQHIHKSPYHRIVNVPYKYNSSQLACGWGDPSNIVYNNMDGYYYFAVWNRNKVGLLQEPGTCIVRTNNLFDTTSYRGYNGITQTYDVTFTSPYNNEEEDEEEDEDDISNHICTVIDNIPKECAILGLSYSMYFVKFVGTIGCFGSSTLGRDFYISTSDDFIQWSEIQRIYSRDDLPQHVQDVTTSIHYPALIDPLASPVYNDINYQYIGRNPYLFWVSFGHNPHTDGRSLWATPMEMTTMTTTKRNDEIVESKFTPKARNFKQQQWLG